MMRKGGREWVRREIGGVLLKARNQLNDTENKEVEWR